MLKTPTVGEAFMRTNLDTMVDNSHSDSIFRVIEVGNTYVMLAVKGTTGDSTVCMDRELFYNKFKKADELIAVFINMIRDINIWLLL